MNTIWTKLYQFQQKKIPLALVSITKIKGSAPCKIGNHMLVTHNKEIVGTIGGGKLEFLVIDEAIKAINQNQIIQKKYKLGDDFEQCCGGIVELIIEPMNKQPNLYIFGAGHIGVALCEILKNTPFSITLLDTRDNWENSINISKDISFSNIDFDLYKSNIQWKKNCYVVIMTHSHQLDFEITALAIEQNPHYIGLIGSQSKKNKFHLKLIDELNLKNGLNNVHCPIGLNLGGNSPQEIAISVAAELLSVYYEK
ncbi:MAG: xanthine dehydrogenase accessory protein XdhC [Lutibacter sp.]